jgi:outer membrane assembly lipoprotein YfiO
MRSLRIHHFLIAGLVLAAATPSASAAWVWSPQTGWVGPTGAVKDSPEEQLAFGQAFFERKEYDRAIKEFRKLLKAYKESREAAEAQYYLGRCYEEDGDYYRAFLEYRKTVQTYPSTKRFEEILEREYQIGNYFLAGKKRKFFGTAAIIPARDKAVEVFQAIVDDGPFSEHGQLAQYKLGLAHMGLGDYEAAVTAFEQVIARYPDSPLVDDARFQIAQASLKGTFKVGYDQSPTALAAQELAAFVREYPESDLHQQAAARLKELRERQAQHEFEVGRFYERCKRTTSARVYYETIVTEFTDTAWAPQAAARLQVIEQRT